jgi:O-acetyl-ADP-ribose deacetylase (regulator of RNase III)
MKIIVVAKEKPLLDAWKRHCGDLSHVKIRAGGICDSGADAAVCPLSSQCKMDRGISLHFKSVLGAGVEERLSMMVREHHGGHLPVGSAEIVTTGSDILP